MALFNLFKRKQPKAERSVNGREAAVNFTRDRAYIRLPKAEDLVNPPATTRREILSLSRYMVANSSLFERALTVSENYSVGNGITYGAATPDQEYNKAATDIIDGWQNSVFSSHNHSITFYQAQKLLVREVLTAGEAFLVLIKAESGFPSVMLISSENCKHSGEKGDKSVDGLFVDQFGKVTDYQFFVGGSFIKVGAEDVVHLMRVKNVGQLRGTSMLETALNSGRDIRDLISLEKRSVKTHSALGVAVTKQTGNGNNGPFGTPESDTTGDPDAAVETAKGVQRAFPGATVVLSEGEKIELLASNRSTAGFHQFVDALVRDCCLGIGLSYELLVNAEKMSGAGIRFIIAESAAYIESLQTLLIDSALRRVITWVLASFIKQGKLQSPKTGNFFAMSFGLPKSITVDQSRNDSSAISLLQNSLITYDQYFNARGLDYREALRQRAEEERYLNELSAEYGVDIARLRTLAAGAPSPVSEPVTPQETPNTPTK